MKRIASYIIYTILLACIACACSDSLDIQQSYEFKVTHLPIPKKLIKGESAEIRCQLVRSGKYECTKYFLRYFQLDGRGDLLLEDGTILLPNDTYVLEKEEFRLYFVSGSEDQQVIDIYFFDNMGNKFDLSFSFNHDNSENSTDERTGLLLG